MRVIFMGTPDFAVPTLDAMLEAGHEVVLVVAQPDKPAGRGKKMRAPPVAARAKELGLPLAQPRALRRGPFPERFCALNADVAVVIAYGRILPLRLLEHPKHGCVNVHASLLPRWRGAAPIQAAIRAGDPITGVCTQRMEEGLDTGPVYLSEELPIGAHETAGELHDRLSVASGRIAVKTLAGLGSLEPAEQDEALACWASKISKADGEVDFSEPAAAIDRQIRAYSPWPGGWTTWKGEPLKLKEARPVEGTGRPREILSLDPLRIACGEGAIELVQVQASGRKAVSGRDFANGARLAPGGTL
jgi:methionyl-tRNA formyltransferase